MDNVISSLLKQGNWNVSDNDAEAGAGADSGGNDVIGGLLGINAGNLATATAAAVNVSPITQINLGLDLGAIIDGDLGADIL
jgi:hypothetical protein